MIGRAARVGGARSAAGRPACATFECHGVTVGVRASSAATLDALWAHLPPGIGAGIAPGDGGRPPDVSYRVACRRDGASGRTACTVTRDAADDAGGEVVRDVEPAVALEALARDAEFRIACSAPHDVFVHAGVVAVAGRAALLPGYSFAGKSTLVTALVRAGATYFSDEFAVLTRDGLVAPFPRPIATRSATGEPGPRLRAEDIGGVTGVGPLAIGTVIVTRYVPGATWAPAPLTRGQTVLALLEHAVTGRTRPAHALARVSAAVDDTVTGLRGDRGAADDAARRILERLRR